MASPSKPGAITASTKTPASFWAVASSTLRFRATMPPKADIGSHSQARSQAWSGPAPTAVPHGFVCFTITQAGSLNSVTSRQAASRSRMLLKESSLPCSLRAAATE